MRYEIDQNGQEILIDNTGFQVMMEWEKPYMEALIDNLKPFGDVLEIGFGMGYSADHIQKHNINTHTIIEDNEIVLEKLHEWAKHQDHEVIIVEGTWQQKLKTLGQFDSIFYDDSPNVKHQEIDKVRFQYFYNILLHSHVRAGARMSFYKDNPIYWVSNSFVDWSCKEYKIDIPESARYITDYSKNAKTLYLPLLVFHGGSDPSIIPYAISGDGEFGILNSLPS